jgi:hypothetical protein
LFEHDLFGKPVSTFPDHALGWRASKPAEAFMAKWIGTAVVALALLFAGAATIDPAVAAPLQAAVQKPEMPKATDLGARRRVRHHLRYAYRPYDRPHYLDRPYYYAPAPNLALTFGFGFGPWW